MKIKTFNMANTLQRRIKSINKVLSEHSLGAPISVSVNGWTVDIPKDETRIIEALEDMLDEYEKEFEMLDDEYMEALNNGGATDEC